MPPDCARALLQGERAPAPVFLDPDGTPTDDPNALVERGGTPMLWGAELNGFRGFALSLWTEALSLLGGRPFFAALPTVLSSGAY